MAFTQDQLDAIEEAIASGTLEVQYSDKKITYRSLNDLLRTRDLIARKLGQANATNARLYPELSKGTECGTPLAGCRCMGLCSCGFQGRCV